MNGRTSRACCAFFLVAAFLLILTGCATAPPQEDLIVPPVSAQLGTLKIKQVYVLQRQIAMNAIHGGNAQPEIHLPYDKTKDGPPPAEALERVPFGISATADVTQIDPNTGQFVTTTVWVPAGWGQQMLDAGTQVSVSSIEVYSNSHVYRGRILTGFAHNCNILLVVPVGDKTMPAIADMQLEDVGYLAPAAKAAAVPAAP
jgi:hypothetical protein